MRIPEDVVRTHHAKQTRTAEANGPEAAIPPAFDSDFVPTRRTISAGIAKGFNNMAKLATRNAFRFRTYEAVEIALYHQLAKLPDPQFTYGIGREDRFRKYCGRFFFSKARLDEVMATKGA